MRSSVLLLNLILCSGIVSSQTRWTFEFHATIPYNVPLPLSIRQSGQPDINLTAHYSSEPLVVPICWLWRINYWTDSSCWTMQALHHKIYLDNAPSEVQDFSVSHGLNLILISRGWQVEEYILRVGAGLVLAHPENTIRGKQLAEDQGMFGWGYYIAGPAVAFSAGREFDMPWNLFLVCEAMIDAAYASVPVVDGSACVYNLAARLNVGLGFRF